MVTWVVGAAGKIGSDLTKRLIELGHEVVAIGRQQSQQIPDARWCLWDIKYPYVGRQPLPVPDQVFFLAGQTSALTARSDVPSDIQTNVVGLANVVVECSKSGNRPHVIVAGAVTESALDTKGLVPRASIKVPVTFYEVGKSAQRLYLSQFARESLIEFTVLRLSNVYGGKASETRERSFLDRCIRLGIQGKTIECFAGGAYRRDYLHIDDAVSAFLTAMSAPTLTRNVTFDIGTGISTPIKETLTVLQSKLKECLGRDVELVEVRPAHQVEAVDLEDRFVDSRAFQESTGWKASIALASGIEREVMRSQET